MKLISQRQFSLLVGVSQPRIVEMIRLGRLVDTGSGIDLEHPINMQYAEEVAARRRDKGLSASPWEQGLRDAPDAKDGQQPRRGRPRKEKKEQQQTDAPASFKKRRPQKRKPPEKVGSKKTENKIISFPPPKIQKIGAMPESVLRDQEMRNQIERTRDIENARKAIALQKDKINYLVQVKKLMPVEWHYRSTGRVAAVISEQFSTFADRHADQLEAMAKAGAKRAEFYDFLDSEIDRAMTAVQLTCDKEIQTWKDEELNDE
jgi:hypothetical protein